MSRSHSIPAQWLPRVVARAAVLVTLATLAIAALPARLPASEPVATFSIVGYDPATGELGIAVQSKFFAVGAVVPWAEAGVGAIATQAFANTTFGPEGLDLLAAGRKPDEVIAELTDRDQGRDHRQIGIVDAIGRSASFTGPECADWAGHETGRNWSAQGNILAGEAVVLEMGRAFEETDAMLGERLMRALEAGQAAGGDSRGMQSAAILVVKSDAGYGGFNDRFCDLRIDDHSAPIAELRRIFDLWKWNALIVEGYTRCAREEWDRAFDIAERLVAMKPEEGESWYHSACFHSKAEHREDALENLAKAIERDATLGPRALGDTDFTPLRDDAEFLRLTGGATSP